jgi:hypothetical protein
MIFHDDQPDEQAQPASEFPPPVAGDRFLLPSCLGSPLWRCWEVDPSWLQGARPVSIGHVYDNAYAVLRGGVDPS